MKILEFEATYDPTRLEKGISAAVAERGRAHVNKNVARELIRVERQEKKERKLFDDTRTPKL